MFEVLCDVNDSDITRDGFDEGGLVRFCWVSENEIYGC